MVLKGFPRISETFISNEILLARTGEGIPIRIISLRHPRESFSHESVKNIRAGVDYLPSTILGGLPRLMAHNLDAGRKAPQNLRRCTLKTALRRFLRTRKSATLKHLLQAGVVVNQILPGQRDRASACPFCPFADIGGLVCQPVKRPAVQFHRPRQGYLHRRPPAA